MTLPVLPTTVVGSYPQPDWLVDRALVSKGVPRVRPQAIWRILQDLPVVPPQARIESDVRVEQIRLEKESLDDEQPGQ